MHPYGDRLAFALVPIPVWKQRQYGLVSPPGLVVIEVVLGKTAHVDDAELRVDRRPAVRCGLAAVIEAGPGKASGEPFAGGIEFPPLFGGFRPWRIVQVIGTYPVAQLVGRINAARGHGAGRFRADAW